MELEHGTWTHRCNGAFDDGRDRGGLFLALSDDDDLPCLHDRAKPLCETVSRSLLGERSVGQVAPRRDPQSWRDDGVHIPERPDELPAQFVVRPLDERSNPRVGAI